MSDPIQLAVSALFAAWFMASIVVQFRGTRLYRTVRRVDKPGLLACWQFFARAIDADYDLVVGWREADGAPLTYGRLCTDTPLILRGIWNPAKRRIKVVLDSTLALLTYAVENPAQAVDQSVPYRKLLELAHRYAPSNAVAVRFLVIRTLAGSDKPEVIIRSLLHPIPAHGS